MAKLRFFVLQIVLAAALAALWLKGHLQGVIAGESHWFVLAVAAIGCIGLLFTAAGRIGDAARLRDLLPVGAVLAMQLGIVAALAVMGQALMSSGDPSKAVGGFFGALSTAMHVSVAALACYIWLTITLWLSYGE